MSNNTFIEVGNAYFFRGVTFHTIGRVVEIRGNEVLLEDASWVADSGRWCEALTTGKLVEVEPYGPPPQRWVVRLDACNDYGPWPHDLPEVAQ